ncbi:MAG TPA: ATP synthase F0 subunit B [Candidatus Sulfotelmatobacter sp.]|nr:ATP synthase F0 subunit B [Candidatus Sulfotelmatobacter sp.]
MAGVSLTQDHPSTSGQPADAQQSLQHAPAPEALKEHRAEGATSEPQEEDQTAQFKKSGAVRMIARLTNLEVERAYWLADITNFLVIVVILVWAGRKVLPGAFRDRTAAIQKAMQEAQKASAEARQKLAEVESRLAKLDSEIAAMRDTAEKDAAAEEARIKAAAEEDARKIVSAAEQEIAAAAKAARRQLTAHAADLAVGLAQKQIRVDSGTDEALVRNFAGELGAVSDNPRKEKN